MDIEDGLIAYFKLNEQSGKKVYDSANYFNASDEMLVSSTATLKMTDRGGAAYFNALTTDKVGKKKPSGFDLETSQMTISCWVKFDSVSNYRYLFCDYSSDGLNAQFALQHTNTNRLTFFWARSGTQSPNPFTAAGTTATARDVWYHCVGVREGATGNWTAKIYVNGILENSTTTTGNPARRNTTPGMSVGAPGEYAGLNMAGSIQRAMIWNRPLTATEILKLYATQKNLINNWGMP